MRNLKYLLFILFLPAIIKANDFSKIYYFDDDYIFVKTVYNGKNDIVAKQEYKVKNVDSKTITNKVIGETTTIKDGEKTETISGIFLRDTNKLMIGLGKSKTGQNVYIDYPINYSPKQKIISFAEFETQTNILGKSIKLYCKVENRVVSSLNESITTKIGTFRCEKYEYDMELKGGILGINIPVNVHVIEWFASNAGVIKTEIYKKGKLYERRELNYMIRVNNVNS